MAVEVKQAALILVESTTFRQGMNDGVTRSFYADPPRRPVTEADVSDFLQGNVVELAKARLFRRRTVPGTPVS
jgi:hypothetical protein